LIAQGSSLVYEAFDRRAASRVAVKLIARAQDADTRERVLRQAALHASVEHPCLVPLLDVAALSDGTPYVVSELANAETLASLLRTPALNTALACEIISHVLGALGALHRAGLVQGGLEPGAILLDSPQEGRRRVRLLAAGFADLVVLDPAAVAAGVERDSARLYRAPEQLGSGTVNVRTDLYAVGALLHELLTGVLPHQDVPAQELAALRMREPIDDRLLVRASVGSTLSRFVCTALARDPAERFASAEEMLCELHAARADESCLWRLPARSDAAVREVAAEAPVTTPVVPIVQPKSPLDSAIWRTQETELSLVAAPRPSRSGWKALAVGFCVTLAAGAALVLPFDPAPPGSNASVAPVVSVETSAPSPLPRPAEVAEPARAPAAPAALPEVPPAAPATPAPSHVAGRARSEHPAASEPVHSAPVSERPSSKPKVRTEVTPHHRRGADGPRELPANPY
jgi:hypothetical protein